MPLQTIPNTCRWLMPGQILTRKGREGTKTPKEVVLEVDHSGKWFKARTCNIAAGTVGPTTTTWIDAAQVGGDEDPYKIIGMLYPQPKSRQVIESLGGQPFKVLSVVEGKCTVAGYDRHTRKLLGKLSKEYALDGTFWQHFKVFWPKEAKYSAKKT